MKRQRRDEQKVEIAKKPTSRVLDVHSPDTNRLLTIAQLSDLAIAKIRYAGGPGEMEALADWHQFLQLGEEKLKRLCEAAKMPLAL